MSARGIFSGGSEIHQGRACKGGRRVGSFQKICKKSMKNLAIILNFQENFAIFSKFFEILSNFWRKFGQFRKLRNMHSSGGGAPRR